MTPSQKAANGMNHNDRIEFLPREDLITSEDAKRLVACWNACIGIDTALLKPRMLVEQAEQAETVVWPFRRGQRKLVRRGHAQGLLREIAAWMRREGVGDCEAVELVSAYIDAIEAAPPAPMTAEKASPLTDERIVACVQSIPLPRPMGLVRDVGPYEITEPTQYLRLLVRSVEQAIGSPPAHERQEPVSRTLDLWFFRELSDEQRMSLFRMAGLPADEIRSDATQRQCLHHILGAPSAPIRQEPLTDDEIDSLSWHLEAERDYEEHTGAERLIVTGQRNSQQHLLGNTHDKGMEPKSESGLSPTFKSSSELGDKPQAVPILTSTDYWDDPNLMALNAELDLSMEKIEKFGRAVQELAAKKWGLTLTTPITKPRKTWYKSFEA